MSINVHATAVILGRKGFLIEGASGSGKTTLALAAISALRMQGGFAALIADDRCDLEAVNGRLIAACPAVLANRVELYGLGIVPTRALSPAVIDGIILLTDPSLTERMTEPDDALRAGIQLPLWRLASRQITQTLPVLLHLATVGRD